MSLKLAQLAIDPRIIGFFVEVLVKYLNMKTNFAALKVEQIINNLHQFYSMENTEFASQIRIVVQQQQTIGQVDSSNLSAAEVESPPAHLAGASSSSSDRQPQALHSALCQGGPG